MGRITPAAGLLMFVNLGFIAAGVMLIKFANDLSNTGWLDALNETDYKSAAGTLIVGVKSLGIGAIALALIGIVGAAARLRILLMIYSFLMVASMIIFGVIGGTAFSFNSKMKAWESRPFPAEQTEGDFAVKFNEIYCYAQGAYFCNNATTTDLIKIFLPGVPAEAAALLPKVSGLNSLCAGGQLAALGGSESVCMACKQAARFAKFDKILAWADNKCPRTAMTSTWCATFLQTSKPGEVFVNSPYKQCRTNFLDVATSWGNSLTMMGAAAFLASALLLALSCFARRSRDSNDDDHNGNFKA